MFLVTQQLIGNFEYWSLALVTYKISVFGLNHLAFPLGILIWLEAFSWWCFNTPLLNITNGISIESLIFLFLTFQSFTFECNEKIFTVCYYHVTYEFQSESTLYNLSECQGTPCFRPVWLNGWVFVYELNGCGKNPCNGHSSFFTYLISFRLIFWTDCQKSFKEHFMICYQRSVWPTSEFSWTY